MTGSDRYYGYGPISSVCTRVITTLFAPATSSPSPSKASSCVGSSHGYPSPPASGDSSPQIGGPSGSAQWQSREGIDTPPRSPIIGADGKVVPDLMDFIAYALYRTRLPTSIIHSSLVLLTRLKKLYPSARGTSSSPHRLFLSALMLASKMAMDDTYSNRSWCIVGQQLFTLSEVNRMERELFGFLNWNCCVSREELEDWRATWVAGHEDGSSSSRRRSMPAEERKRRRSSATQDHSSDAVRHRQATDAARALLKPVGSKDATASVEPLSPKSPSSTTSSQSSLQSSDWTGNSEGSTPISTSVCGSSPSSRSSESPASTGPRTPEGSDAPYPVDTTYSKDWLPSREYEGVEAF